MKKISEMIEKFNILDDSLEQYGKDVFKINPNFYNDKQQKGKLVVLTSINPTKYGEGKTTCAIGLADGLNKVGTNAMLALREPSMGPVFGRKGTATGGGECVIVPEDRINLHFTGDIHAITAANNLVAAAIDSSIYWGNDLNIDLKTINWPRCMDVNDRSLRKVEIKIRKDITRTDKFTITAASKMMTILSLAASEDDLRKRLENTIIAMDKNGNPIYMKDLDVVGSVMATLKEALIPNLVFSKHGTPALVHCGPFANIATGTNSAIATKLALKLSDVVVTETGFASELGFEKFANVVSVQHGFNPDCVVLVVTVRALKEKGDYENNFSLLNKHISNVLKVTTNLVVTINVFSDDSNDDLKILSNYLDKKNISWAYNRSYVDGPDGATEFAKIVLKKMENKNDFHSVVKDVEGIEEKIRTIVKEFYYEDDVVFNDEAKNKIAQIKKMNEEIYKNWPIILAKSPVTINGNDKNEDDYVLKITDIELNGGARFILAMTNNVIMMPGLPSDGNYKDIDLINGKIANLK